MFMHVPCYNLPRVNRAMARKGVLPKMLTAPGYVSVLRLASSKATGGQPAVATAGATPNFPP
jgi:fatty acid desaturase